MKLAISIFKVILKPTAYLDPGTGSVLIQLLLAGLLGIGVAIRIFWDKIKRLFKKENKGNDDLIDPTALDDDLSE